MVRRRRKGLSKWWSSLSYMNIVVGGAAIQSLSFCALLVSWSKEQRERQGHNAAQITELKAPDKAAARAWEIQNLGRLGAVMRDGVDARSEAQQEDERLTAAEKLEQRERQGRNAAQITEPKAPDKVAARIREINNLGRLGVVMRTEENVRLEAQQEDQRLAAAGKLKCEEDAIPTYAVCNGFSNQLLGHAGFIANLIMSRRRVAIPDAFIFNGVQHESDGQGTLKNVVANKDNSIPLTSIIDGHTLQKMIRSRGVDACFIPHSKVIFRKQTMECSWLTKLRKSDNDIEMEVLDAMKPSISLSDIVETTFSNLQEKSSRFTLSDGVCLHHRDAPDWHNHCTFWKGNNCRNVDDRAIEDLVKDRIPAAYAKKWMYYVGDARPSAMLTDAMKNRADLELLHRGKDQLLDTLELEKLVGTVKLSLENHRDIFAAVDFFVCSRIPSFIGNSVSMFSALQIAKRRGKNSTWYNSRSNPLLVDFTQVQQIPIVYTYTEESQLLGKILLKTSITSVRQAFGMGIDVNIVYHGTHDKAFLKWLAQRNVIIHSHEPTWLPMIDSMISNADNADKEVSHLYSHRGNYLGTWQRIDIPLFIDAEYILLLDADTIVHTKFDLSTFGLDITPGIAFSNEGMEKHKIPLNAGVALFNVPKLRETYDDFIAFVQDHADRNRDFVLGPSDQGAYLDFYHSYKNPVVTLKFEASKYEASKHDFEASNYVQFLDMTFNVKPYYKNKKNFAHRKIVHYHGLKPHEIMKGFMGYSRHTYATALHLLLPTVFGNDDHHLLCLTLHDFAVSIAEDQENLKHFCLSAFPLVRKEQIVCKDFLSQLSKEREDFDCVDIFRSHGFAKDGSLMQPRSKARKRPR